MPVNTFCADFAGRVGLSASASRPALVFQVRFRLSNELGDRELETFLTEIETVPYPVLT